MKRNNAGFTLIEVMIAIVVLGLIVMPICTSLIMSVRMNAKAESMLDAKLAVSSAVEELMATGIDITKNVNTDYDTDAVDLTATSTNDAAGNPIYYTVTVTSKMVNTVSVTTHIRVGGGS